MKHIPGITVIIPIAPIPSHPGTDIIDETLAAIRERLPDSEIILMFDGLPANRMELKAAYEQHKQEMLWRCAHVYKNVVPMVQANWMHQTLMTKRALDIIRTPYILWSEQDTPLHGDIPLADLLPVIGTGYANSIRFHHEASILDDHQYLMLDQSPIQILGQPFLRHRQWSGRPHLASTKFYREIAAKYWDDQPRFIEHVMYGKVVEGDYDEFRLHMYAPEGTLVRSLHRDGRRYGAQEYDPNAS